MKIYIVLEEKEEYENIYAIFDSEEKANNYINNFKVPNLKLDYFEQNINEELKSTEER